MLNNVPLLRYTCHHAEELLLNNELAFVGFISGKLRPMRPSIGADLRIVDKKLVADLVNTCGLLGYSSLELHDGNSHALDALLWQNKDFELQLRVIARLGPSSIPPVAVARSLDSNLKCRLQEALITMHNDPSAADGLHKGGIDHFVAVTDADYNDIRTIFAQVQAAMKA